MYENGPTFLPSLVGTPSGKTHDRAPSPTVLGIFRFPPYPPGRAQVIDFRVHPLLERFEFSAEPRFPTEIGGNVRKIFSVRPYRGSVKLWVRKGTRKNRLGVDFELIRARSYILTIFNGTFHFSLDLESTI